MLFPELHGEERNMALQYVAHADETERRARILRVQQSIEEERDNPPAVLTKISHEVDKEKEHVFNYEDPPSNDHPLMRKSSFPTRSSPAGDSNRVLLVGTSSGESNNIPSSPKGSTVFEAKVFKATSTGSLWNKKKKPRQRPPAWVRHVRPARNTVYGDKEARPPMYKQDSVVDLTLTVRDLWLPNSQVWNAQKLFETFTEEDTLLILKIRPSPIGQDSDVPEPTTVEVSTNSLIGTWEKPPSDMVKCNVGMAWSDTCLMSGSSWIVRDYQGQAIQHSRQAITGSSSKRESDIRSLLWAVQAMGDLRHKKVLFEASSLEVREALLNPLRFPELSPLILKILELLNRFEKWAIFHVSAHMNRIAKNIAESVILGTRLQSYVAAGGPCWLHEMLEEDANST
ncbi:hypothetical protein HID58_012915 [Brassica napus]|uniref:RNase H type-1 domain-containing protein n=1 Tax=Brassica napus TaxID=3708 RepID=A0ABQ8E4I8_BRANA|nr:hypothetical protein HID58_012915 [Brassica napus]